MNLNSLSLVDLFRQMGQVDFSTDSVESQALKTIIEADSLSGATEGIRSLLMDRNIWTGHKEPVKIVSAYLGTIISHDDMIEQTKILIDPLINPDFKGTEPMNDSYWGQGVGEGVYMGVLQATIYLNAESLLGFESRKKLINELIVQLLRQAFGRNPKGKSKVSCFTGGQRDDKILKPLYHTTYKYFTGDFDPDTQPYLQECVENIKAAVRTHIVAVTGEPTDDEPLLDPLFGIKGEAIFRGMIEGSLHTRPTWELLSSK